jgi:hypothetical protein
MEQAGDRVYLTAFNKGHQVFPSFVYIDLHFHVCSYSGTFFARRLSIKSHVTFVPVRQRGMKAENLLKSAHRQQTRPCQSGTSGTRSTYCRNTRLRDLNPKRQKDLGKLA